jgi:hypothetical protein
VIVSLCLKGAKDDTGPQGEMGLPDSNGVITSTNQIVTNSFKQSTSEEALVLSSTSAKVEIF